MLQGVTFDYIEKILGRMRNPSRFSQIQERLKCRKNCRDLEAVILVKKKKSLENVGHLRTQDL